MGLAITNPEQATTRTLERGLRSVHVLGTGSCVPDRVLTNHDLERLVDTSDDWILARTGMRERRLASPGQGTSDLCVEAARRALEQSELLPADIELILVATVTADNICPPAACRVQTKLGAHRAAGFDINAACSGFMNALFTGHHLVAAGAFGNALVIGADILSSITDYEDRESCVLFGDGAGAFVIGPQSMGKSRGNGSTNGHCGQLLDHVIGIDGSGAELIIVPAGGSLKPASRETVDRREHFLSLQGRKVFRFAVTKMAELVELIAIRNGIAVDDIDLMVPHQANLRIIEAGAHRLGIGMDRVFVNVDRFGNTSSASVPMALDEAARTKRLERGMLVCMMAFGGGLSWGATLMRW
ncbi:MAG: beta-ketoacyl-ACP synthase III [Planctomycetota bacterium]|jgi:3-oxoacyl-[acyl-carrier-protein] synthase-3